MKILPVTLGLCLLSLTALPDINIKLDVGGDGNKERRLELLRSIRIATRELKDVFVVDNLVLPDLNISMSLTEQQENQNDPIVIAITVLVLDPTSGKLLGAITSLGYWRTYKKNVQFIINYLDETPFQNLRDKQRQQHQNK